MWTLHIPATLGCELDLHLFDTGHNVGIDVFAAQLLQKWLDADRARIKREQNKGKDVPGYQWKDLFLPDGTSLRTSVSGVSKFAKVRGEHILSNDQRVSPSQFANESTQRRSAWRCVWLRFPGEEQWRRAADCRPRKPGHPSK